MILHIDSLSMQNVFQAISIFDAILFDLKHWLSLFQSVDIHEAKRESSSKSTISKSIMCYRKHAA